MHATDHSSRAVRIIATLAVLAMPFALAAQQTDSNATSPRRRAAKHSPAGGSVALSGTVTDAVTGAPIAEVDVIVGEHDVVSDERGQFQIPDLLAGTATVTFQRWGYQSVTRSITIDGTPANASLAPKPVVLVKDTHGVTYHADYELSQFGYVVPFSNLAKADTIDLCKTTGEHVVVDKSTISKITGPAIAVSSSACCKVAPVLSISVTLKGGAAFGATISDSCFNDEVFAARDRDSLQWVYLKFTDIAEIDFPQ